MGKPLALAACPVCYEGIRPTGSIYAGRREICPSCRACLVVVQEDPDAESRLVLRSRPGRWITRRARTQYVRYSGVRAADHWDD